jgi:ferredoxin
MVYVNTEVCNGCGDCVSVCPNDAMILQNNHAFIDQELCQGCAVCVDSCPQGAILTGEPDPVRKEVIKIPSTTPAERIAGLEQPSHTPLRNALLPTIGAVLMWTGRELVPRVADLTLGYLDRRIQLSKSVPRQAFARRSNRQVSRSAPGGGRGRRRQRRRRNKF